MSGIAIIGAGITGPAAALALASAGHDVTVYEQRHADELFSAGLLGLTPGNWAATEAAGADLARVELGNGFFDYGTGLAAMSPFRYIAWVDLHAALVSAAMDAGARFAFGRRVDADHLNADVVMDAGGIFSASRRLASRYTGYEIYRGLSDLNTPYPFMAYRDLPDGYFTVGYTRRGAAWALFTSRPQPQHLATVDTTQPPAEADMLPDEFRRLIYATPAMIVSPMSDWDVPTSAHTRDFRCFTLGDANGPVRPVTTSGANLAVIEGLAAPQRMSADHDAVRRMEHRQLTRRAFDIRLGAKLDGPEIGGHLEDVMFAQHHSMLFSAGER